MFPNRIDKIVARGSLRLSILTSCGRPRPAIQRFCSWFTQISTALCGRQARCSAESGLRTGEGNFTSTVGALGCLAVDATTVRPVLRAWRLERRRDAVLRATGTRDVMYTHRSERHGRGSCARGGD